MCPSTLQAPRPLCPPALRALRHMLPPHQAPWPTLPLSLRAPWPLSPRTLQALRPLRPRTLRAPWPMPPPMLQALWPRRPQALRPPLPLLPLVSKAATAALLAPRPHLTLTVASTRPTLPLASFIMTSPSSKAMTPCTQTLSTRHSSAIPPKFFNLLRNLHRLKSSTTTTVFAGSPLKLPAHQTLPRWVVPVSPPPRFCASAPKNRSRHGKPSRRHAATMLTRTLNRSCCNYFRATRTPNANMSWPRPPSTNMPLPTRQHSQLYSSSRTLLPIALILPLSIIRV